MVVPAITSTPFSFSVPLVTVPVIRKLSALLTPKPVSLSDTELSASANVMCVVVTLKLPPSTTN